MNKAAVTKRLKAYRKLLKDDNAANTKFWKDWNKFISKNRKGKMPELPDPIDISIGDLEFLLDVIADLEQQLKERDRSRGKK